MGGVSVFCRLIGAAACACMLLGSGPARAGTVNCLGAIPATMIDSVDSATAKPGQAFRFETTEPGVIVVPTQPMGIPVPKGTLGWGVVRAVSPASRGNHYGSVTLEPRYLVLPKGRVMQVSMNPTLPAALASNTPGVEKAMSHVPIPIPGLAMTAINTIRYGKNVRIGPGYVFSVVPIRPLALGPDC